MELEALKRARESDTAAKTSENADREAEFKKLFLRTRKLVIFHKNLFSMLYLFLLDKEFTVH